MQAQGEVLKETLSPSVREEMTNYFIYPDEIDNVEDVFVRPETE